jgi:hypothetical protein
MPASHHAMPVEPPTHCFARWSQGLYIERVEMTARLKAMGWDSEIVTDAGGWVIGTSRRL